jgi:hypothetical protein
VVPPDEGTLDRVQAEKVLAATRKSPNTWVNPFAIRFLSKKFLFISFATLVPNSFQGNPFVINELCRLSRLKPKINEDRCATDFTSLPSSFPRLG